VGFICTIKKRCFSDDTSTMLDKVLNDAVSDTTGDDSSNVVDYIIIPLFKELTQLKTLISTLSSPIQTISIPVFPFHKLVHIIKVCHFHIVVIPNQFNVSSRIIESSI
jgi:hypothetical protein